MALPTQQQKRNARRITAGNSAVAAGSFQPAMEKRSQPWELWGHRLLVRLVGSQLLHQGLGRGSPHAAHAMCLAWSEFHERCPKRKEKAGPDLGTGEVGAWTRGHCTRALLSFDQATEEIISLVADVYLPMSDTAGMEKLGTRVGAQTSVCQSARSRGSRCRGPRAVGSPHHVPRYSVAVACPTMKGSPIRDSA